MEFLVERRQTGWGPFRGSLFSFMNTTFRPRRDVFLFFFLPPPYRGTEKKIRNDTRPECHGNSFQHTNNGAVFSLFL